jgi:hypothetical protein
MLPSSSIGVTKATILPVIGAMYFSVFVTKEPF